MTWYQKLKIKQRGYTIELSKAILLTSNWFGRPTIKGD